MCAPGLHNQNLSEMFTAHLNPDRGLHYGEFINNVRKHMVRGVYTPPPPHTPFPHTGVYTEHCGVWMLLG